VGIWISDMSGIQMVATCPIVEWSGIQMVIWIVMDKKIIIGMVKVNQLTLDQLLPIILPKTWIADFLSLIKITFKYLTTTCPLFKWFHYLKGHYSEPCCTVTTRIPNESGFRMVEGCPNQEWFRFRTMVRIPNHGSNSEPWFCDSFGSVPND
jgi:hypothetical protein